MIDNRRVTKMFRAVIKKLLEGENRKSEEETVEVKHNGL